MRDQRSARWALLASFTGMGATASAVPAVLPMVQNQLGDDVRSAVPALFFGLLLGVLASSPLLVRFRALRLTGLGCFVQAGGLTAIVLSGDALAFVAGAAAAGLGFGLAESSGSVGVKELAQGSSARPLTVVTAMVAGAAAVTPLVVAAWSFVGDVRVVLAGVAVVQVIAGTSAQRAPAAPVQHRVTRRWLRGRSVAGLLPLVCALPLYVGVESALAGWSALIAAALLPIPPAMAASGTSMFWILMAAGRLMASSATSRWNPQRVATVSVGSAAVLLLVAGGVREIAPAICAIALIGAVVALAPTYAVIIGLGLDRLDAAEAARATGLLVAAGAVGGAALPATVLAAGGGVASGEVFGAFGLLCAVVAALIAVRPGEGRAGEATTVGDSATPS